VLLHLSIWWGSCVHLLW